MARSVLIIIGLVVLVGIGAGFISGQIRGNYAGKKASEFPQAPIVNAIGGSWKVKDLEWQKWDGAWRIQALFVPHRVEFQGASANEFLKSICGAILTSLPSKPAEVGGRENIYRVDLNAILEPGSDGEFEHVFERPVPVPVLDGACKVPDRETFVLFPTYPGELIGWQLEELYLKKDADGTFAEIVYFWEGEGQPSEEGFPYQLACEAAMDDRFVLDYFAQLENQDLDYALADALRIEVNAKNRFGNKFLHFYKGGSVAFDLVDNACLETDAGETL